MQMINIFLLLGIFQIRSANSIRTGRSNMSIKGSNQIPALLNIEIGNILIPFSYCTTTVIKRESVSIANINFTAHPILIFTVLKEKKPWGTVIQNKFTLLPRRNLAPHCWASLVILPNKNHRKDFKPKYDSIRHLLIGKSWQEQYLIWSTAAILQTRKEVLTTWSKLKTYFALREIILVDLATILDSEESIHKDTIIMQYPNPFYLNWKEITPEMDVSLGVASFNISCLMNHAFHCYQQLAKISIIVADLNKYFWKTEFKPGTEKLTGNKNVSKMCSSPHANFFDPIVCAASLHEILVSWIFHEIPKTTNIPPRFIFKSFQHMSHLPYQGMSFVLHRIEGYNFISCYKVWQDSSALNALTSPFDMKSWMCMAGSALIVTLLLNASLGKQFYSTSFLLTVGILLESSVLEFLKSPRKFKTSLIIGIWTVFSGTVLTSWYKTAFTMEMFAPVTHTAPWEGLLSIDGIKVLMPMNLFPSRLKGVNLPAHIQRAVFFMEIHDRAVTILNYSSRTERFRNYRKMARLLINLIFPKSLGNIYNYIYNIYNIILVGNLSTCRKVALIDRRDRIDAILPFLNDNREGITYLVGEDDFFTTILGWPVPSVRRNFAMRRLTVMISSGIYYHWKSLFKMIKPRKLFHHYSNWTYPKVERVTKLDFNSKIMTAFYICGMFLVFCGVTLILEITLYAYVRVRQAFDLFLNVLRNKDCPLITFRWLILILAY